MWDTPLNGTLLYMGQLEQSLDATQNSSIWDARQRKRSNTSINGTEGFSTQPPEQNRTPLNGTRRRQILDATGIIHLYCFLFYCFVF